MSKLEQKRQKIQEEIKEIDHELERNGIKELPLPTAEEATSAMMSDDDARREANVPEYLSNVTEHHVAFLRARGYQVVDISSAREFISRLDFEDVPGFFDDAATWVETSEAKELEVSNDPSCEMCGNSARGGQKVLSSVVEGVEVHTYYCAPCWKKSGG